MASCLFPSFDYLFHQFPHRFFPFDHHRENEIRTFQAVADKPAVLLAAFACGTIFACELQPQSTAGIDQSSLQRFGIFSVKQAFIPYLLVCIIKE